MATGASEYSDFFLLARLLTDIYGVGCTGHPRLETLLAKMAQGDPARDAASESHQAAISHWVAPAVSQVVTLTLRASRGCAGSGSSACQAARQAPWWWRGVL